VSDTFRRLPPNDSHDRTRPISLYEAADWILGPKLNKLIDGIVEAAPEKTRSNLSRRTHDYTKKSDQELLNRAARSFNDPAFCQVLCDRANQYRVNGDLEKSELCYQAVLDHNSESKQAIIGMNRLIARHGEEGNFEKYVELSAYLGDALHSNILKDQFMVKNIAVVRSSLFKYATRLHKENECDKAVMLLELILKWHPDDADTLRKIIFVNVDAQNPEKAEQYLDTLLETPNKFTKKEIAESYKSVSYGYYLVGEFEKSLPFAQQAQKICPGNVNLVKSCISACLNICDTTPVNKKYYTYLNKAKSYTEQLFAHQDRGLIPENERAKISGTLCRLGSYLIKSDPELAIDCQQRAIALNPGAIKPLVFLAETFNHLELFTDAAVVINEALKRDAENPHLLYVHAENLWQRRLDAKAQQVIAELATKPPEILGDQTGRVRKLYNEIFCLEAFHTAVHLAQERC
jgi:tetratricopeptide (TPR) repeat protein